jgi:hypothetical protein
MMSFVLPADGGTGIALAPAGPRGIDGGPTGTGGRPAGGLIDGIAGTAAGSFGIVGIGGFAAAGSGTRDLQLAHATNLAPTGTSDSAMRLCVPQAEQVASIIQEQSYPWPDENAC